MERASGAAPHGAPSVELPLILLRRGGLQHKWGGAGKGKAWQPDRPQRPTLRRARGEGTDRLDLSNTRVSDAGLKYLKGLSHLHDLYLHDTRVSDTGLVQLQELGELQWLGFDKTYVTRTGMDNFARALPKCGILRVSGR